MVIYSGDGYIFGSAEHNDIYGDEPNADDVMFNITNQIGVGFFDNVPIAGPSNNGIDNTSDLSDPDDGREEEHIDVAPKRNAKRKQISAGEDEAVVEDGDAKGKGKAKAKAKGKGKAKEVTDEEPAVKKKRNGRR
ncbi:hypothetical protein CVT24_011321 [Panaeolus cyanescens]|uniref:Uncharacterized protein n=1 Tax=Panaeolus cyanescens TaxID=181874 RepID=A0A409YV62_9AGAR|nr:hypothetical protein CVT24_011321 [Panaeolus cyanescens]